MRILRDCNERRVNPHGAQGSQKLSITLADVRAHSVAAARFFLSKNDRISPYPLGLRKSGTRAGVGPAAMIVARLVGVEAGFERELMPEVCNQRLDVGEAGSQLNQRQLSLLALWATVWEWHPASFATELIDTA
jgi:hypothetical protein